MITCPTYLIMNLRSTVKKEYKSAKIWVTLGGPNVWIDTAERAVKLAWWTDRAEYPLDWDVCEEIDDIMREIYEC